MQVKQCISGLFPFHVMVLYLHCLVHCNLLFGMIICYFALYLNHPKRSKYLITTSLSQSVKTSISPVLVASPQTSLGFVCHAFIYSLGYGSSFLLSLWLFVFVICFVFFGFSPRISVLPALILPRNKTDKQTSTRKQNVARHLKQSCSDLEIG